MYDIEVKIAPKSVWFTPAEAKSYYGRYDREGVVVHWWGDGSGADNHDNIVNFFLNSSDRSVNYVVSDKKITMMVRPDDVAWASQSGNPTTVSIEHQPTLSDEGYKRSGWLVSQLEERFGKRLTLYPHSHWFNTDCPGTIDLNRIRAEADKYNNGDNDMIQTDDDAAEVIRGVFKREPTPGEIKDLIGRSFKDGIRNYRTSGPGQVVAAQVNNFPILQQQIATLQAAMASNQDSKKLKALINEIQTDIKKYGPAS